MGCRQIRFVFLLVLPVLLAPSFQGQSSDAKALFKEGDRLCKTEMQKFDGYRQLHLAVERDPSNRKYVRRLEECGRVASVQAESIARASNADVKNALLWFQE